MPADRPADRSQGTTSPVIKARVTVTLKRGVLDPQGKAIEGALSVLGFGSVDQVRQGKVFDLRLKGSNKKKAEADLVAMCESAEFREALAPTSGCRDCWTP